MKILVPTKRVPSTDEGVRIRPDGSGIEDTALVYIINPFDAIALEEALHIREQRASEVEVTAVSIGNADFDSELRTALAMGADRAVRVDFEGAIDPWSVAQVLAAVVRREKPDLVLMGKQAVDDDRSEEHTSELQSQSNLVCRLLLEKKKNNISQRLSSRPGQDAPRLPNRSSLPADHELIPGGRASAVRRVPGPSRLLPPLSEYSYHP